MSFFEFSNLSKSFDNRILFDDISYKFNSSSFVALLGESGSGKTTLFNILVGFEKMDKGDVIYLNKKLKTENDFIAFRNDIAFVFQEYGVLNYLNCYDNLSLGGYNVEIKNNNLLQEDKFKKRVGLLSGGEKQRLALLKALSLEPKILFCDEPTGALDEDNSIKVMNILKEYSKNHLVIMVTHNISLANIYGDTILKLENHKITILKEKYTNDICKKVHKKRHIIQNISISLKSFLQEKIKLLFTFLALGFSFASLLMMFNLSNNISKTVSDNIKTYADYNRLKISQIEENEIEGTSFSLSKTFRPDRNLMLRNFAKYGNIEYNLDYFFQGAEILYNDQKVNISIITLPIEFDIEEVRMNNIAKEIIYDSNKEIVIEIHQPIITLYNNSYCVDEVNYYYQGKIRYIYDEFNFLNTPCLYVSYPSLKEYMQNLELKKLSEKRGIFTSLYDRFSIFSLDDEDISMYSFYLDINDENLVYSLYANIKKISSFSIESRAMQVGDSLYASFDLIELIVRVFSSISLFITICLLYLLVNSSFNSRKKEFSLYRGFGFKFYEYLASVFIPLLFFFLISYFLALVIFKLETIYLNNKLYSFFFLYIFQGNLININSFVFHIVILFVASFLYSLPYSIMAYKIKVSEVIKSE